MFLSSPLLLVINGKYLKESLMLIKNNYKKLSSMINNIGFSGCTCQRKERNRKGL